MLTLKRSIALTLAVLLGLLLTGCDKTADPDVGQRDTTAESVLQTAKSGDKDKLLQLSATDMQGREPAAQALVASVGNLRSGYTVKYAQPHGSPSYYIVTATDDQGGVASFELSWLDARWQLILGTAGPPKSPPATVRP